jgi:glycosyltransferase involved in cell wall biosynthesis
VGLDWRRKNGDAVLRAFVRLRQEVSNARLDVVGFHPPLDADGVTGHGAVPVSEPDGRAKIERLFEAATCFVLPSFVEPFGIVYVEAAAAGLPSIATTVGGTTDSVGPGGILVDPYDDEAVFQAMRDMCDPDTARTLGAVAHERSAAFTWPAFGQRVLRSFDFPPAPGVELAEFL